MDEVVPDPMTDGIILDRMGTDAQKWAEEWCRVAQQIADRAEPGTHVIDQGWMIGWFANAIEAGRGAGIRYHKNAMGMDQNASAPVSQPLDTSVIGDRWRRDLQRAIELMYGNPKKYLSVEMIDEVIREEFTKVVARRHPVNTSNDFEDFDV